MGLILGSCHSCSDMGGGNQSKPEGGSDKLNRNLLECKKHLLTRIKDPKMMEKTVEFMNIFMQTCLNENPKTNVPQLMMYTNLAMFVQKLSKHGDMKVGAKWLKGLKKLTK